MNHKTTEIDFSEQIKAANEGKTLNKPFRTPKGPKKFSVYVKNEKGNVVKVNFGDPNMEIKRDDPNRRKSFRARHNCDNPGPKTKARYWSCRQWRGGKKVEGSLDNEYEWDGETLFDQQELLKINPSLINAEEVNDCEDCETEATHTKPSTEETHEEYMKRCQEAGHSKEECMMSHKGHEFKSEKSETKQDYASLWENIRKKKERIKSGSGEKMRKKGEKGAPSEEQIKKAQGQNKQTYTKPYSLKASDEEEAEAKKRRGPKSGAQTPAKPSERRKGSSKNKKGSAGKDGGKITFSEQVVNSLKEKVRKHNEKSKKKVTLSQLKKVYRRGAGAFSSSHRPGQNRQSWAMARVNMFLKMARGGSVKKSYRDADGDLL
tara:strand:- start:418 stop:1545 length:1128 start_codon:yes stop_codon:yes gene_type:complete